MSIFGKIKDAIFGRAAGCPDSLRRSAGGRQPSAMPQ